MVNVLSVFWSIGKFTEKQPKTSTNQRWREAAEVSALGL